MIGDRDKIPSSVTSSIPETPQKPVLRKRGKIIRHLCCLLENHLHCKGLFTPTVKVAVFLTVLKWVERIPVALFTYGVKRRQKDERCLDKNGDFNGRTDPNDRLFQLVPYSQLTLRI